MLVSLPSVAYRLLTVLHWAYGKRVVDYKCPCTRSLLATSTLCTRSSVKVASARRRQKRKRFLPRFLLMLDAVRPMSTCPMHGAHSATCMSPCYALSGHDVCVLPSRGRLSHFHSCCPGMHTPVAPGSYASWGEKSRKPPSGLTWTDDPGSPTPCDPAMRQMDRAAGPSLNWRVILRNILGAVGATDHGAALYCLYQVVVLAPGELADGPHVTTRNAPPPHPHIHRPTTACPTPVAGMHGGLGRPSARTSHARQRRSPRGKQQ